MADTSKIVYQRMIMLFNVVVAWQTEHAMDAGGQFFGQQLKSIEVN